MLAAQLSNAIYQGAEAMQHLRGFVSSKQIENTTVSIHRVEHVVYVVFAGTSPSELSDIRDDLRACQTHFFPMGKGARVHAGFLEHTARAWSWVTQQLVDQKPFNRVVFTGHSLGGAAATIMAAYWSEWVRGERVDLITFGSPRVGNWRFASRLLPRLGTCLRFVNHSDIVPRVPKLLYWHVGKPAYIDRHGHCKLNACRYRMWKDRTLGRIESAAKVFMDDFHDHGMDHYEERICSRPGAGD